MISDLIYWLVIGALMIMSFLLGVFVSRPSKKVIE